MKSLKIFASVIFFFLAASSINAQVVVKVKPVKPRVKVVTTVSAHPGHVWINGHWKYSGGRYVWVDGYYVKERPGHVWVSGHWKSVPGGWKWVPGHWK